MKTRRPGRTGEAALEIGDDVHERDVSVVGRVEGREVFVDAPVAGGLGCHVVEVVGGREPAEVLGEARRPARPDPALEGEELAESVSLGENRSIAALGVRNAALRRASRRSIQPSKNSKIPVSAR